MICTEWKEFRAQDAELFVEKLGRKLVVDGRNLYDPKRLRGLGLDYRCVGRPA